MRRLLALTILAGCGAAAPVGRAAVTVPCSTHRIGQVAISGAPRAAVAQLAVLEGTLDDPERTARIAQVAADGLRTQGYVDAEITVARRRGCGVDLDIAVTLGKRYRITQIAFDTDDAFPQGERLAVIEDALGTVNTLGGVYIDYRMRRALTELEKRYRDAGWLEARLGEPHAAFDRAGTVAVRIPVTAGRRFRIGSVRAVGAGPLAREVLQSLGLRSGDYYDGPRIRSAIERARHKLARWVELRANVADGRPEIDLEAILEAQR